MCLVNTHAHIHALTHARTHTRTHTLLALTNPNTFLTLWPVKVYPTDPPTPTHTHTHTQVHTHKHVYTQYPPAVLNSETS